MRAALSNITSKVPTSDTKQQRIDKEAEFLVDAHAHLADLNARYFPQSGMTQKEVVAATAARVGLQMPKQDND